MADTEKLSTGKHTWYIVTEAIKFLSLVIGIVISTFTLKDKLSVATDKIDATNKAIQEQTKDIKVIREALISKGIIPPFTGN